MVQLQYTSRLSLDARFFDRTPGSSTWWSGSTRCCPRAARSATTRPTAGCASYRRIDHLNVVTSSLPPELSNASDFSRTSVEARIQAGYDDAIARASPARERGAAVRGDGGPRRCPGGSA